MGKETSKECLVFFKLNKEGFFFLNCPSRNLKYTEFSSRPIGAFGLFWNATKQRSFWRIFSYILYSIVKKITYLWIFYRTRFIHFEIGLSALIWDLCWVIFAMCSADFTCVNGSTSQICVTRITFKDYFLGLWIKMFREIISLSIFVCSFIDWPFLY